MKKRVEALKNETWAPVSSHIHDNKLAQIREMCFNENISVGRVVNGLSMCSRCVERVTWLVNALLQKMLFLLIFNLPDRLIARSLLHGLPLPRLPLHRRL